MTVIPQPVLMERRDGPPVPLAATKVVRALDGPAEGYVLDVDAGGVRLRAGTAEGLFHAEQTLGQLVEDGAVAPVHVEDRPRFAWRGAMLDVARHFFTADDVKAFVDDIAAYKLNVLHLHLTDDEGWRFPVASLPDLTAGGPAYTREEYAGIVAHAAERFVTVVPEIDMPGHTAAARRAYPLTDRFVEGVVSEVAAMTPGPWLHIGGDEADDVPLADFVRFMEHAQRVVTAHGKRVVGWEELARAPLSEGAVVQYWNTGARHGRELARVAVRAGARLLLSPADRVYLDMKYDARTPLGQAWAGHVDVDASYGWDPATLLDGVSEADVIGVEAALWTETLATLDDVRTMAFPRLPAVAEVAWSPAGSRDWPGFRRRLAAHAGRWRARGIAYHPSTLVDWPD